jgi:hypothetical protein
MKGLILVGAYGCGKLKKTVAQLCAKRNLSVEDALDLLYRAVYIENDAEVRRLYESRRTNDALTYREWVGSRFGTLHARLIYLGATPELLRKVGHALARAGLEPDTREYIAEKWDEIPYITTLTFASCQQSIPLRHDICEAWCDWPTRKSVRLVEIVEPYEIRPCAKVETDCVCGICQRLRAKSSFRVVDVAPDGANRDARPVEIAAVAKKSKIVL